MAKAIGKSTTKKAKFDGTLPLERENYLILGAGLVLIVAGYVALSGDQVEGFLPLTLSPILLILGYCVVIPAGIMYRKKAASPDQAPAQGAQGA
jgi:hypothetical protein